MTEEEIIKGNQLIADFMGAKPYGGSLPYLYHALDGVFGEAIHINHFKFHKEWNWIMPVWQKFRDLKILPSNNFSFRSFKDDISNSICWHEVENVFEELCAAISWYNSLDKTK